ncbi:class I SAM-dependent methyltransferase [Pelagibius marinus]|uniref:class I SAM-dependent methyltransferase n=1 Tax=Pelagibius marinus TaxID=2762760 RepID=UPI0018733837|nr:class I SAM-dependent methyltransferase [Pelagibius marinus]
MSRLDSFLRRLQAQRDCLNVAVAMIAKVPGPIFELGLGNGRTYDHLREACPRREIFVFERQVSAHPDCIPDAAHLLKGDVGKSLAAAQQRFAGTVALAHADLGSGNPPRDAETAAMISARLPAVMAPGGVIISDQELTLPQAEILPLPPGVQAGRYFMYLWPKTAD